MNLSPDERPPSAAVWRFCSAMSRSMPQNPDPPQLADDAPEWSPETRTWVSLLLFVHLFVVVVAVTSYTRPSALQLRLHALFAPYLRNLHLTALPTTYPFARFHLTHATESDVDFAIRVDTTGTDGAKQTITLPEPLQPLVRFRRYQNLANAAGTLASGDSSDAVASILPKTVAGSILRGAGATSGVIRIEALGLPTEEDVASLAALAKAANEKIANIYEAQVIATPTTVELLKKSTTLEVAPVQPAPRPTNQP
jgi:hypothetical protein